MFQSNVYILKDWKTNSYGLSRKFVLQWESQEKLIYFIY